MAHGLIQASEQLILIASGAQQENVTQKVKIFENLKIFEHYVTKISFLHTTTSFKYSSM